MNFDQIWQDLQAANWQKWAVAFGVFVGTMIAFRIIKAIGLARLKRLAKKTKTDWDDFFVELLNKNWAYIAVVASFYAVLISIELNPGFEAIAHKVLVVAFTFTIIQVLQTLITFGFQKKYLSGGDDLDVGRRSTVRNMVLFVKIILWATGFLLILDNLGFDVTTAIAGLGVGGIAIAMAAQAILADFFSYFTISFDKPFEVGDFIVLGDQSGTVEHVGVKTTRIRSISGELIVVGNTDLTGSRIKNFKKMQTRRVVFALGVTYETSAEKLKAIPGIIKEIVESEKDVRFDRVHFKSYGDFSLNFEIVYTVLVSDYAAYMDVQQDINYKIFDRFAAESIDFAYPTQMLYVNKAS